MKAFTKFVMGFASAPNKQKDSFSGCNQKNDNEETFNHLTEDRYPFDH